MGGAVDDLVVAEIGKNRARHGEPPANLLVAESGAEIAAGHAVDLVRGWPRGAEFEVIGGQCRAERAAGIARRRLHPHMVELAVAQDLAVGDAIERHTAGEAQISHAGFGRQCTRQPQNDLFGDTLDRGGEVHVHAFDPLIVSARRHPEQCGKPLVGHAQPGAVVEILLIQAKAAVVLQIDQMIEDRLREARLAVGGEPHDLVLARIDAKAGEIGKGRVQETERMRKVDLLQNRDLVAGAEPGRGRRPFADPVHRQDHRRLKGRREKGRGRVAQMVLGKQQASCPSRNPAPPRAVS